MVERTRVLQLIDGFATEEQSGGAALFAIQLARHLDREQFDAFVCGLWRYNTASERRWLDQLRDEGIGTAVLVDQPGPLGRSMLRAAGLLQVLLGRLRPQIVNSHFERGDLLALWSRVADPSHPRIVRTMHTDVQWQKRPWLGRLLNPALALRRGGRDLGRDSTGDGPTGGRTTAWSPRAPVVQRHQQHAARSGVGTTRRVGHTSAAGGHHRST
jgi:hypothetical protein